MNEWANFLGPDHRAFLSNGSTSTIAISGASSTQSITMVQTWVDKDAWEIVFK